MELFLAHGGPRRGLELVVMVKDKEGPEVTGSGWKLGNSCLLS